MAIYNNTYRKGNEYGILQQDGLQIAYPCDLQGGRVDAPCLAIRRADSFTRIVRRTPE